MRISLGVCLSAISLTASASPPHGLELRGIQLGNTCEEALKAELALGAHPRFPVATMRAQHVIMMSDTQVAGEPKEMLYHCTDPAGIISSYSIIIEAPEEAHRASLYQEAKAAVVARLGAPTLDSEKLSPAQKARVAGLQGAPSAVCLWRIAGEEDVSVRLQPPIGAHDPWQVTTSVSEPNLYRSK